MQDLHIEDMIVFLLRDIVRTLHQQSTGNDTLTIELVLMAFTAKELHTHAQFSRRIVKEYRYLKRLKRKSKRARSPEK